MTDTHQVALGTLYDRYAPSLYGLILGVVNDHPQTTRLVERTFLRAWATLQAGQTLPATNQLTWLLGLARSAGFTARLALPAARSIPTGAQPSASDRADVPIDRPTGMGGH